MNDCLVEQKRDSGCERNGSVFLDLNNIFVETFLWEILIINDE